MTPRKRSIWARLAGYKRDEGTKLREKAKLDEIDQAVADAEERDAERKAEVERVRQETDTAIDEVEVAAKNASGVFPPRPINGQAEKPERARS